MLVSAIQLTVEAGSIRALEGPWRELAELVALNAESGMLFRSPATH